MPDSTQTAPVDRRRFLQASAAASVGLGVLGTGCDMRNLRPSRQWKPFSAPKSETVDLISHALSRLTWGAAPGEYERVQKLAASPEACLDAFVEEQLAGDPRKDEATAPWASAIRSLSNLQNNVGDLYDTAPRELNTQLTQATLTRFLYSPHQLYEVMVSFWTDHFNIDYSKTECRWLKTLDDREVVRRHALGNFREMLKASALSPAMLFYLDGRANRVQEKDDAPNENYARELLELHTLGVHGGYTQEDVMQVARCLSGWTVNGKQRLPGDRLTALALKPAQRMKNVALALLARKPSDSPLLGIKGLQVSPFWGLGRVHFVEKWHDTRPKTVLGVHIPPNGAGELDTVLELVAKHPATARFIAQKLCRRFIADEPPEAAVAAVAQAFKESECDIKATLRALFRTPEFRQTRGNKHKRPLHWIISALRATGADSECTRGVQQFLRRAGQMPFEYPTPDGYPDEAGAWQSTLLARWDAAVKLTRGRMPDVRCDPQALLQAAGGREALLRHVLARTPRAQELLAFQEVPEKEHADFVSLLLASPDFQLY
jgi:uncharacterized protein (DUF1800 family)